MLKMDVSYSSQNWYLNSFFSEKLKNVYGTFLNVYQTNFNHIVSYLKEIAFPVQKFPLS